MAITPGMFDGEVEKTYTILKPGVYQGKVTNLELRTASSSGNDFLNIEFTINGTTKRVWDKLFWHNEKCVKVTKGKLESLGFSREERKKITNEQVLQDAVNYMVDGKVYDIHVGIGKDQNGEDQNVVKYVTLNEEETGDNPW